jgi:hypothetical protein
MRRAASGEWRSPYRTPSRHKKASGTVPVVTRVLVVGAPRSGTTWIGKALGHTANATYVHEPDGTADPFAFAAKLGLAFTPVLAGDEDLPRYERLWAGAFSGGQRAGTARDRLARKVFTQATQEEKQRARQDGEFSWRLRLARAAAVPLVPDPSKQNVVVKSVHAPLAVEWVWRRFEPTVLVVRRHPYNVLASRIEMGFNPGLRTVAKAAEFAEREWGVEPLQTDDPPLLQNAFHLAIMLLAMTDALQRHPKWHSVSHEELCTDPVPRFRALAARLGLDWSTDAETFLDDSNKSGTGYATNRIAEEQPDRWRERLTADQVSTIDAALARFPDRLLSAF